METSRLSQQTCSNCLHNVLIGQGEKLSYILKFDQNSCSSCRVSTKLSLRNWLQHPQIQDRNIKQGVPFSCLKCNICNELAQSGKRKGF